MGQPLLGHPGGSSERSKTSAKGHELGVFACSVGDLFAGCGGLGHGAVSGPNDDYVSRDFAYSDYPYKVAAFPEWADTEAAAPTTRRQL
jgi:hypothetical protein